GSRYITHIRRLLEPEKTLARFLSGVRLTADHLGPLLFQLPPRWQADPARLEGFLAALPTDTVNVIEFRDASWYVEEIRTLLARFGVNFCIHDHGAAPSPAWITGPAVYLRFHGSAEPDSGGNYSSAHLKRKAEEIRSFASAGRDVYAYFNNDWGGYAVTNAMELKKHLGLGEAARV
ncbi:MAG TPA: DUF72 domain-containing protein, partial [Holophagaceae bacterium]